MHQGRPLLIFRQINDANGVARLAKSARKQFLGAMKALEKSQAQLQKVSEKKRIDDEKVKKYSYLSTLSPD